MSELETLLSAAGKVAQIAATAKAGSWIEYTGVARVEPICALDSLLAPLPYTHDILQALNAMVAGWYLQAVQLGMTVGDVSVTQYLDKFNPNRGVPSPYVRVLGNGAGVDVGIENYTQNAVDTAYGYKLPILADILSTESFKNDFVGRRTLASMEIGFTINDTPQATTITPHDSPYAGGADLHVSGSGITGVPSNPSSVLGRSPQDIGKGTIDRIGAGTNLAVGIMLDVHVESKGCKAVIPVTVRLSIAQVDPGIMNNILTYSEKNKEFTERWHGWRAGELEFVKDLVLCQDLIAAHKKTLMKDESGVYAEILARRQGNRFAGIVSGNPSIATASNIFVISEETALGIERAVGGRLSSMGIRNRIFNNSYILLLVVVDPLYEHVTIYHRGIALPTQLSIKEIKGVAKSKGPDVAEILKAYSAGSAPSY